MKPVSRRSFLGCLAGSTSAACLAAARSSVKPSSAPARQPWEHIQLEEAGFSAPAFATLEQSLYALPTTALLVVRHGKIAYSYGEPSLVSYVASVRKSILSLLYGKYVERGIIDLDRSLGELGIDEDDGLLPIEKTATIRDLLMSSSGVYHPAGSPGSGDPPARGSRKPGTHFVYNNWDFNVAGAIFERLTGKSVFQSLADDLAAPLSFEDFDPARQRMLGYEPRRSRYLAYHLFLSARDLARVGVMALNGGRWGGKQIVPEHWIRESTTLRVRARDMAKPGASGYGYLWWLPSESRPSPAWAGAFAADGNYGQYLLMLPAIDTVIVHRRYVTDEFAIARNRGETRGAPPGGVDCLGLADRIVAALQ